MSTIVCSGAVEQLSNEAAGRANIFLIIESQPIFRWALGALLGNAFPGSRILTAGTLNQGRQHLLESRRQPIVLLDGDLPDSTGAHGACELIRIMPGLKIIVLSAEYARSRQTQLLKSGVHGFLSKTIQPEAFVAKLNELVRAPHGRVPSPAHKPAAGEFDFLSERQRAIVIELSSGRSNKEIARRLGISPETVKTHVSEIIRRLGVRNRTEAIRRFVKRETNDEDDE